MPASLSAIETRMWIVPKTTEHIIMYSMSENTLDKSRLKSNTWKITPEEMVLRISVILLTMVFRV